MGEEPGWSQGLAGKIDGAGRRLEEWSARQSPVPELRQRVRALAVAQWGGPVDVIHLGDDVTPVFAVPGRRRDGTLTGRHLVRRFFWNALRGTVNGVVNVFLIFNAGGGGDVFAGRGSVTGPANAQALGLVDAARAAKGAWLAYTATDDVEARRSGYSPEHMAVIDLAASTDAEPTIRWHAEKPDTPRISPARQRLTWPDGSIYQYDVTRQEATAARGA